MQLYFIRHAQSANNLLYDLTGAWDGRVDDPDLTEAGVRQAELLASHLAERRDVSPMQHWDPFNVRGFFITHLYASPMVRAAHTATLAGEAIGLSPVVWEDLHESGGIYLDGEDGQPIGQAGKNRAYFEQRFPSLTLPETIGEAGWWNHRPIETAEEKMARAKRVWRTLLGRHGGTDHRVAVVSHGDFFVRFMTVVLDIGAREHVWLAMGNTAITRLDVGERADPLAVIYQGRVTHLPFELMT